MISAKTPKKLYLLFNRLLFRYPFHPYLTEVARKNPGHSVQAAGYSLTRMHPTYVASNTTVNWCVVVRCTQNVWQDGSSFTSYTESKQRCKYTTSVDHSNTRRVKLMRLIIRNTTRTQLVCSEAGNSAI